MAGKKGRSGRPKKPTKLHVVQGTYRKDRANPNEPKPKEGRPEMSDEISPKAIPFFERICDKLEQMRVLTEAEGPIIELYAETMAEYWEHKNTIQNEGSTFTTVNEKGNYVLHKHPAVQMMENCRKFAADLLKEFGLTPSARSRIIAHSDNPKESKWQGL